MKDTFLIAAFDSVNNLNNIVDSCSRSDFHKLYTDSNTIFHMSEGFARIFIPAIITLLVFILSQLVVWYRNQRSIQLETNNYKDIILCWAELIRVPIEKQITELNALSEKIRLSEVLQPEGFSMNKMLADKVDSISVDRYISTFMINTKTKLKENINDKMTFNLVSQFNYLTLMEKSIVETYNTYQKDSLDIMDEWNVEFKKLSKCIDNLFVKVNNDHVYFAFKQKVVTISMFFKKATEDGTNTMVGSMDNLISPLTELTTAELNHDVSNEFAFQISEVLQYLRFVEHRWKVNNEAYNSVFKTMGKNIKTSLDSINEAKKYFETNTKTKNILQIGK